MHSSRDNRTQPLELYRGKLLIAVVTSKAVYNSQLLELRQLGATSCDFVDFETRAPLSLDHAIIARNLRCACAMTFASVQGRGFSEVGVHTSSAKFSSRHLFMALSRCESSARLWIMD